MAQNKPDYYKILEIAEQSSFEEIKSAFRKMAMKYHPDRNQGNKEFENKFKEINEAYEVLSDPVKRAEYDVLRKSHFSSKDFDPFRDFNETFEEIFKNSRKNHQERPTDKYQLQVEAELSIEQMEFGCSFRFTYQGKSHRVEIPAGRADRENLLYTLDDGREVNVHLKCKDHDYLEREGFDLYLDLPLTYGELQQGLDAEILILTKRIVLHIAKGLQYGAMLRLKDQGLTDSNNRRKGTLYVTLVHQKVKLSSDEIKQILKMEAKQEIERPEFVFSKKPKP